MRYNREINAEIYLKKRKMKREDMEKIDHNMSEEKKQKLTECQKKKKKKKNQLAKK